MISNIEARTLGRVAWRLLPFLGLLYFVSFLDRVNVSFAKLQMNKALDLSDTVFATGAGIFFVGYFLFEVPSNLMLERFGARRWIARIMVTWGIISAGMAFTRGENSFYALRFLLGLAEAGFFPGIILYLTYWFPAAHRAKIVGLFMVAIPVSGVIGGPISGYLLAMDGYQGLGGWQWLYLLEGLPAVVLGIVTLFLLTDRPAAAHWLEPDERDWLEGVLASERRHREAIRTYRFWETLASPRVLALALVYFGTVLGLYGLGFWLPTIVKGFGLTSIETGWVTAIPPLLGALFMVPWSRHSDRTGERVWHMVVPCFLGFLGFVIAGQLASPTAQVVFLSVAAMGRK